jgi:integrase
VNAYKTSGKYDAFKKVLPDELAHILKMSLAKAPREYLFVRKNGGPFSNNIAFAQWNNNILKQYLGQHATVNSLRHAATKASLTDPNKTYAEHDAYARDMGHSYDMHRRYNRVIKKVDQS